MKLKPEHVEYMRRAILDNPYAPTLPDYLARGLTEKRWRWDLLLLQGRTREERAAMSQWICDNVYPYANDDNIDTALRHILGARS